MQICAPLWLGVCVLAMCLSSHPARAQMLDKRWTLTELIDRALDRDGEVASGRWKVESADARRRQAAAAKILPRLRIDSKSGLVPDAMGSVFNPPADTTGFRSLGPFARAELQFVQPLYPFSLGRHLKRGRHPRGRCGGVRSVADPVGRGLCRQGAVLRTAVGSRLRRLGAARER